MIVFTKMCLISKRGVNMLVFFILSLILLAGYYVTFMAGAVGLSYALFGLSFITSLIAAALGSDMKRKTHLKVVK